MNGLQSGVLLMNDLHEATRSATRALQDVASDLAHMGETSAQWAVQLKTYIAISPHAGRGELWELSRSISQSAINIMQFCHRTRNKVERTRAAVDHAQQHIHNLETGKGVKGVLGLVWTSVITYLVELEKALDIVEGDFANQQETMLEIALNHGAPDWAAALAELTISQAKRTGS